MKPVINKNIRTVRSEPANKATVAHTFSFKDKWGRVIGAEISTFDAEWTLMTEEPKNWSSYSLYEPGHYFAARCQQTRGGKKYGAWQSEVFFTSAEARDAHIAKYLASAQKAAAKKFIAI